MCESRPKRRSPVESLDRRRPVVVNEFDGTVIWRAGLLGRAPGVVFVSPATPLMAGWNSYCFGPRLATLSIWLLKSKYFRMK
jgi:hypothetical protein